MASPPFNINQALPGDSDIVSQFPTNERANRDIIESWMLINHNVDGNHTRVDIPRAAAPSTPAAGIDTIFTSTTGRLKIKHPDGTEEYVGVPPATIIYSSAVQTPVGWLNADGSAVLRATYPDLFATISTFYGIGDGSTTFNVPDLRGRAVIGPDGGSTRISTATMSSIVVGGIGGVEINGLVSGNIPSVALTVSSLSVTVSVPTINVSGSISGTVGASSASGSVSGSATGGSVTGSATGSVTGTASVTSSDTLVHVGGVSDNYTSVAGSGTFNTPTRKALTSSGSISASFSSGAISGSLTSPATVTGSFSGATVTTGAVSGTFTGTGSGSGTGTGTGSGTTTGSATGTSFSNMQPSMVQWPLIKT